MKQSVWRQNREIPEFPPLTEDSKTDVLVIGGGLAGLLCAWKLKQEGIDCLLIEADRILSGVSGNTTAKITSQHGFSYSNLLSTLGPEAAYHYWRMQEEALKAYRVLCRELDCDLETRDHVLYATQSAKTLEREGEALEKLKIPFRYETRSELPMEISGALVFSDQACFDPVTFAAALAPGLNIREKTKVQQFAEHQVITNRGRIRASKVVIATHFPILNKHGGYFLKMYQQRSYVLALEGAQKPERMYLGVDGECLSFRSWGNGLLLGGGGHRTGKPGTGWKSLETFADAHYPQSREICRWAAQDCVTLDGLPYVGQYSRHTPGMFVATGFGKWGMTNAMAAAEILKDQILGRENLYGELLRPDRSILHPQLLKNLAESTVNLLTPSKPRCPHLGCALKWNPWEHSWDCPCHGSRFTDEGDLLDNPATDDLKK